VFPITTSSPWSLRILQSTLNTTSITRVDYPAISWWHINMALLARLNLLRFNHIILHLCVPSHLLPLSKTYYTAGPSRDTEHESALAAWRRIQQPERGQRHPSVASKQAYKNLRCSWRPHFSHGLQNREPRLSNRQHQRFVLPRGSMLDYLLSDSSLALIVAGQWIVPKHQP
jgi:hypothetical protein